MVLLFYRDKRAAIYCYGNTLPVNTACSMQGGKGAGENRNKDIKPIYTDSAN